MILKYYRPLPSVSPGFWTDTLQKSFLCYIPSTKLPMVNRTYAKTLTSLKTLCPFFSIKLSFAFGVLLLLKICENALILLKYESSIGKSYNNWSWSISRSKQCLSTIAEIIFLRYWNFSVEISFASRKRGT